CLRSRTRIGQAQQLQQSGYVQLLVRVVPQAFVAEVETEIEAGPALLQVVQECVVVRQIGEVVLRQLCQRCFEPLEGFNVSPLQGGRALKRVRPSRIAEDDGHVEHCGGESSLHGALSFWSLGPYCRRAVLVAIAAPRAVQDGSEKAAIGKTSEC